jgi:hypothetical protein
MNDTNAHRKSLEDHSPTLFLVAGVLLIGYAALNGVGAFTDMTAYPVLFQFGYLIGFLGLLGVCHALADRSP